MRLESIKNKKNDKFNRESLDNIKSQRNQRTIGPANVHLKSTTCTRIYTNKQNIMVYNPSPGADELPSVVFIFKIINKLSIFQFPSNGILTVFPFQIGDSC